MRRNLRTGRAAAARLVAATPPSSLLVAAVLVGCGGGGDRPRPAPPARADSLAARPCPPGTDAAVGVAVDEYVKRASPKPRRFLMAAGTDSALPDAGLRVLQDKGPTYYYVGSEAQKAAVRARLADVGPFPTLLVVLKRAERGERSAAVTLDGHYVGNTEDGQHLGERRVDLRCVNGDWRVAAGGRSA